MSHLADYKLKALKKMSSIKSMREPWIIWEPIIRSHLSTTPNGQTILDLGEKLSEIFQSNTSPGRDQSDLSLGGAAWECLNVWYLNLLFWDTQIIALRTNKSFVPECLRNALTVTHSTVATNTESDVSIFSVPDLNMLGSSKLSDLNAHLSARMSKIDFVNLQCKTNWNDNAQIPMLWDLIYNVNSFKLNSVSLGVKGVSPNSFNSFKYAFSTVPTVKLEKFKTDSLAVLRVRNISGGNYWGHESKRGIASCINELPNNHYSSSFTGGIVNHLNLSIAKDPTFLEKFLKIDF